MNVRPYRAQNKDAMTQLRDALPEHMCPSERRGKAYIMLGDRGRCELSRAQQLGVRRSSLIDLRLPTTSSYVLTTAFADVASRGAVSDSLRLRPSSALLLPACRHAISRYSCFLQRLSV